MSQYFKLKDASLLTQTGWIQGKAAKTVSGKAPFPVFDPATDEVWAHAESMDARDTDIAIESATKAFPMYSAIPARQRAKLLLKLDELFRSHREDFAQLLVMENGKAYQEALGEVDYAASYTWLMAGECERLTGEIITNGDNKKMKYFISHNPIGPVAVMTPWNFPLVIAVRKIATALAAGCTVVCKPSPETPITTTAFAKLCTEVGFPDGTVNVVTASLETTPEIGQKLCEDPRIKKMSFTGSTRIGKLLMKQCSSTLKKVTLELGGNGAFLVFQDADLEKATTALVLNKFRALGQVCMCANRVFVHESVVGDFVAKLKSKMAALKLGHGLEPGVTNGSLTTKSAPARLAALIEDAVKNGAKLEAGGKAFGKGYHFEPTLLVGASTRAQAYNEEIFGPVISVYSFSSEQEVIEKANATDMGLTNYVFTESLSRAFRVSEAIQSGTVAVNTNMANAAESPFGGIKESGMGVEGGIGIGVSEFCNIKATAVAM